MLDSEKYVAYKPTGIKWIENIPEHWNIQKVKYIFKEISIKNYGKETQLAATQLYGVVPKDTLDFRTVEVSVSDLNTFKLVQENNFVISLRSFEGGIEYSTYRGIISPAYTVMEALKDIDFKYFKYLFKSNIFIQALNIHKTGIREGQNISFTKFKDDFLPLPPKDEQKQIGLYLDLKTIYIDELISRKKKMIELLKEQYAAIIDELIIHGLDKSFKYINTGIKWIENIPEHWNIQKVKYIFKEISIKNYGKETQLAATQLYGVVPKDTLDFRTVEVSVSDLNTFKLVQENNFVISLRSFEGGIEYSTYRGIISPAYTVMEALKDIDFKYFKYLFKSNIFIQALNIHKTGIREGQNISFTKFKDDFLPLPPKDEQKQIAEYIEIQTAKIDKAIELQQNYIAKLKEYKASLIDSVVTGKVRVA